MLSGVLTIGGLDWLVSERIMATKLAVVDDEIRMPMERRDSVRWRRVLLRATLRAGHSEVPVTLCDISCGGARVISSLVPPVGSEVTFHRGAIYVVAQVVRTEDHHVALCFNERIDETALLINIGRPELAAAH
jgi:hypothetical protein